MNHQHICAQTVLALWLYSFNMNTMTQNLNYFYSYTSWFGYFKIPGQESKVLIYIERPMYLVIELILSLSIEILDAIIDRIVILRMNIGVREKRKITAALEKLGDFVLLIDGLCLCGHGGLFYFKGLARLSIAGIIYFYHKIKQVDRQMKRVMREEEINISAHCSRIVALRIV